MADQQQRSLLAMILSGGGRGDPYANHAAGTFASSHRKRCRTTRSWQRSIRLLIPARPAMPAVLIR
jgi:hypothetical protein